MNWTPEQVQERENRMTHGSPILNRALETLLRRTEKPASESAKPTRKKRSPKKPNKTETAYDAHLSLMERLGEVKRHAFEGITLKLAPDCRFTPDFVVEMPDGRIELHDTKVCYRGQTQPHIEDDALVKLKIAAQMYPFKVKAVWPLANGEWDCREFSAGVVDEGSRGR